MAHSRVEAYITAYSVTEPKDAIGFNHIELGVSNFVGQATYRSNCALHITPCLARIRFDCHLLFRGECFPVTNFRQRQ
jgi:hypothetical protein